VDLRWPPSVESWTGANRDALPHRRRESPSLHQHRALHYDPSTSAAVVFRPHPVPAVARTSVGRRPRWVLGRATTSSFLLWRRPRVRADDIWISGSGGRDGGGRQSGQRRHKRRPGRRQSGERWSGRRRREEVGSVLDGSRRSSGTKKLPAMRRKEGSRRTRHRHARNVEETEKPGKRKKARKECKKAHDDKCPGRTREA
jgi:hypothetical protein